MNLNDISKKDEDEHKDFEESEWIVLEQEENKIVSNLKDVATNGYQGTNVRVDQIGPYKIAFRTMDDKNNRMTYENLYKIAKPLQDFLKLPVYIGGSHSPLSKKMPNPGSDIDIYIITPEYSYKESKELEDKINKYIKNKTEYDKCSIGQVEKGWLDFPYFYESVPIDEKEWWELTEEELNKIIQQRKEKSIKKIAAKTVDEVLDDIERIYKIRINKDDIINITTTPRWKSVNDCAFRRGNLIKENSEIEEIMDKLGQWLFFKDEDTTLYDAVRYSSELGMPKKKIDTMSTYIKLSDKNGKYWLFNSILNAYAEALATDAKKINWIIDSNDVEKEKLLQIQIKNITHNLSNYFGKEIINEYVNWKKYFEENGYMEKVEELKKANRKYRKICDLDLEVKLYVFNRLNKSDKLFIINPERKVGKMLKHSGLDVTIPFLNKDLEDFQRCPDYAKKPPSGYCVTGARKLMFGQNSIYECACKDDQDKLSSILDNMWDDFDKNICIKKEKSETIENKTEYSIVDKSEDSDKEKAIILFGAPSIDMKNLLLLKTSNLYSDKSTSIVVEDIMAPHLYNDGIYDIESVKAMYKSLQDSGVDVQFNSEDETFPELVNKWLKKLSIKDLNKLSPLTINSDVFGFHVYDALHLAIMGATYEKVKDKIVIMHSYNETAIHIFKEKLGETGGYISCHQLPENYQGKSIRVRNKDDIEQNNELIEEMMENLTVLYKNRNSQLVSKHSLKGKKINSEREENEK